MDPFSTLNAGSYTITLSGTVQPINFFPTFNAGTGTVKLTGDADIEIGGNCGSSVTYNNLIMGPITASRTITLGHTSCKSVITVNGTFISGSSATNTVSFVKGDAGSNVTNAVTSYYCASNGGIANINCVAGGPPAPGYGSTPIPGNTLSMTTTHGTNGTSTLTVSETGNSALDVTNITVTGTDAAKFSRVPNSFTIADGGASHSVTVACDGSAVGTFSATLNVAHNATGSPATYPLTCTVNAVATPVTAGVSIVSVSNVKATTALATGYSGESGATERGFFWWNDTQYWGDNASGLIPAGGSGAGDFSLTLTNLPIKTQLYVAAYVKVGGQVITSGPGNFISITTTDPMIPTVITEPDFTVNGSEVLAKGEITDVGSSAVTIYGFVYAKHASPTVWDQALPFTWDNTLPISQGKPFEGTIKNLPAGTYYFRAYAHNAQGTSYGEEFSFTITDGTGSCGGGVPGDLNGDSSVDLADVIIALRISDGVPVSNLNLKGDVNGDCKIGTEEAIFVLQKVGILR